MYRLLDLTQVSMKYKILVIDYILFIDTMCLRLLYLTQVSVKYEYDYKSHVNHDLDTSLTIL